MSDPGSVQKQIDDKEEILNNTNSDSLKQSLETEIHGLQCELQDEIANDLGEESPV